MKSTELRIEAAHKIPVRGGLRGGLADGGFSEAESREAVVTQHPLDKLGGERRIDLIGHFLRCLGEDFFEGARDEMRIVRDGELRVMIEHPLQERGAGSRAANHEQTRVLVRSSARLSDHCIQDFVPFRLSTSR